MDEKIPGDTSGEENMKRFTGIEKLSVSTEGESSSSFFELSSSDSTEEENENQGRKRKLYADAVLCGKREVKSQQCVNVSKSSMTVLRSNNAARGNFPLTTAKFSWPKSTAKLPDPSLSSSDVRSISIEMNSLNFKEKTDLPLHLRLGKEHNVVRDNAFSVPYSSFKFKEESLTSPECNDVLGFSVNSEEYDREFPRPCKESVNYETSKKCEYGKQYGILTLYPKHHGRTFPTPKLQEEQTSSSSDSETDEDSRDFESYMKEIEKYNPLLPDPDISVTDKMPLELLDATKREKNMENIEKEGKMIYSDEALKGNKETRRLFYDYIPKQSLQDHSSSNASGGNSPSTSQISPCQRSTDKPDFPSILFNDDIPLPPEFNFLYLKGENERLPLYLRGKKELNATKGNTFSVSSSSSEYETGDFEGPFNRSVPEFRKDSDKRNRDFSKSPQSVVRYFSPKFPRETFTVPVGSNDIEARRNSVEYGRQYLDRASPKFNYESMYCSQQLENSERFPPFPNFYTQFDSSATNSENDDDTDSCFSIPESYNIYSVLYDIQKTDADVSSRNSTPLGSEGSSHLHFENFSSISDVDEDTLSDESSHNYASPTVERESKPLNSAESCRHDENSSTFVVMPPSSSSSSSPNLLQSKRWKNEEWRQPLFYDPDST